MDITEPLDLILVRLAFNLFDLLNIVGRRITFTWMRLDIPSPVYVRSLAWLLMRCSL